MAQRSLILRKEVGYTDDANYPQTKWSHLYTETSFRSSERPKKKKTEHVGITPDSTTYLDVDARSQKMTHLLQDFFLKPIPSHSAIHVQYKWQAKSMDTVHVCFFLALWIEDTKVCLDGKKNKWNGSVMRMDVLWLCTSSLGGQYKLCYKLTGSFFPVQGFYLVMQLPESSLPAWRTESCWFHSHTLSCCDSDWPKGSL